VSTTAVKIKILAFPYYEDDVDPVTGNDVKLERMAYRNDEVELSDIDLERAKRFEAFYADEDGEPVLGEEASPETPPEGEVDLDNLDAATASADQLAAWIKKSKPTVDEVVDEANEDPAIASKLIEAENLATGQQPRSTLIDRLQEIVDGE
jgi:hypothetical protein